MALPLWHMSFNTHPTVCRLAGKANVKDMGENSYSMLTSVELKFVDLSLLNQ